MITDMTEGSITRHLLVFAVPVMFANMLQTLYNVVDMAVVGQFVGGTGLSAVSIGGDITHLPTMMCMGFANAGQIMISQYVGMNSRDGINRTIGTLFSTLMLCAALVTVLGIAFVDQWLILMNAPAESWDGAKAYTIVCFAGCAFTFGYNAVSAVLRGMGDSKRPLVFIAIATVTNIVLDLLFVAVFKLAAFGAALATIISQAVSLACSVTYLYRNRDSFGFDFRLSTFVIKKDQLLPLVKLGIPMSLQSAAINISFMAVNSYINSYGLVISAVTGVGMKLRTMGTVITMGIRTASTAVIAQNLGARKLERVSRTVYTSLGLCVAICTAISCVFLLFPEAIFSIFTSDPEVLAWAPANIKTVVIQILASAMMGPFNALINGLGYSTLSMTIGLIDGVLARVGLAMLMGLTMGMGAVGFWYGSALAGFVTVILAGAYFFSGRWKTREILVKR